MTPEEEATFEILCCQYLNATPFRNTGWEVHEDIKKLCLNKAKGTHSFYSSHGTQGLCDPTMNDKSQGGDQAQLTFHKCKSSSDWDMRAFDTSSQDSPQNDKEVSWSPEADVDTNPNDQPCVSQHLPDHGHHPLTQHNLNKTKTEQGKVCGIYN